MSGAFSHGYALLIGVGESAYPKWSLPVTVKDMQALRAILTDPALCGYPDDDSHIRLLHDAGATKQAILDGLAWLAERAAADAEATAVVFYSGHGWVADGSGKYYLLPHDVEPFDLVASALPAETFTAALRQVKAKRLLVFVDSCHAAGMATAKDQQAMKLPSGFTQTALPKGLVEELKQGAGRAVFSSSTGNQQSWVRPDGSLSLYTYHLIEALRGAGNQPGDTSVRVSNLMNHLGKAVPESARTLCQAEQTPFFDTATEDFVVALLRGGKGLSGAGFSPAQSATASQPAIQARGERSVAAGTISDSTIVTGDHNVVQQGKYNINIGNVQGLVIGDQAQVTQVFGGGQPAGPGQGGLSGRQPLSGDAAKRHLRQQLVELQGRYDTLSKRIAALDTDLGRTLDSEHKLTLQERRRELVAERDQVADEMTQIERQLEDDHLRGKAGTAQPSKTAREIRNARKTIIDDNQPVSDDISDTRYALLAEKAINFTALIREKTQGFVGRRFVFDALDQFLAKAPSGYFIIKGEAGIGKSALMAQLVNTGQYVHHFVIATQGINRADQFLENVCAQLIARYKLDRPARLPPEASRDSAFLAELLEEVSRGLNTDQHAVILVDALDEVDWRGRTRENVLFLPQTLPEGVFIVMTMRHKEDLPLQVDNSQIFCLDPDSQDNREDVIAYITQFAQREAMQPRLQAWDTTPDAFVQTMLVKSERNFMYLWHVLPAIERGEFRHGTLAELPQGLRNYYEHHWRQIRAIDETSWVKYRQPVIYYLAAASAPVTVYQIKSWSKIPSSQVLLAIRDWREFLKIQTVGNETRYHIYHSFFQEFLKDKDEVKTLD